MLIARGQSKGGAVQCLILGLSRGNVERLTAGQPVRVTRQTHGEGVPLGWEIFILFGETERAIHDELSGIGALSAAETRALPPGALAAECEAAGLPLGATGRFPAGKMPGRDDQGELRVAIAADAAANRVVIDFGKPVAWLSLTRRQALELAEQLRRKAERIED
jgi:hypothetical protein